MSETEGSDWHEEEMRLAYNRKRQWLNRRGSVVRWFFEPFPGLWWIRSMWMGVFTGLFLGFLIGVSVA